MKKPNILESVFLHMGNTEKYMSQKSDVVTEEDILMRIRQLNDLEQTDRAGRTLLFYASLFNREKIVTYLIGHQVEIDAKDNEGWTALHAAAQEGNLEIIKILVSNGADIHAKDNYGNSPLMRARPMNGTEALRVLLEYGANPYEKNNFGVCALDIYQAYPDITKILRHNT